MNTDVLIIGGGLTGITAANEIIQNTALQVDLLQCGGGASPHIHGFCIPVGEKDSWELFYRDTMVSGYGQSDPQLVKVLCGSSASLISYFEELGLRLDEKDGAYSLLHSLGSTVPRIAAIENNTGPAMLRTLRQRLKHSPRYTEHPHQRALELLKENDRVIGARCFDLERQCFYNAYARVVILASGGFCRLFPESTNSADIGGDGCAMAFHAGAALTDMEFVQFEPSTAVWPEQVAGKGIVTTMFYDGAVLRGADGRRFMLDYSDKGERVPKDVQARCIFREMRSHGTTPHGGVWFDATNLPEEKWQGPYLSYLNRYLACGIDLRKEPVEIAPAAHTSCGGVRIDEACRTGIPGLIACGEVAGGLHGANRLGGNAGLETMVFGRVAGKTATVDAADIALPEKEELVADKAADVDVAAMRNQLRQLLRGNLNVIRDMDTLPEVQQELAKLSASLGGYRDSYDKFRLHNDILTARLLLSGAMARPASVGCHIWENEGAAEAPYRVVLKSQDGEIIVSREMISEK